MTIKTVRRKGRGVFADRRYFKGRIVLSHEILPVPQAECAVVEKTFLNAYIFYMSGVCFLALGEGSLLNHSPDPNLDYRFHKQAKHIEFLALRKIEEGEELTINYDWDDYPWDHNPPA